MSKFEIEIASANNYQYTFPPIMAVLRGRWASSNVAHLESNEALRKIHQAAPIIPGIRIVVDPINKKLYTYDPLGETEVGKKVWEKISGTLKEYEEFFEKSKPEERRDFDCTPDNIKEWLYWMKRAVLGGHAEETSDGTRLPSLDQIAKMPGRRRAEPFNTVANRLPEAERYVDAVPVKGELQTA